MPSLTVLALLAFTTGYASLTTAQDVFGSGTTTRYWDCCKGSCSWSGKASVSSPVQTCDIHDQPLSDSNAQSGCTGGSAYMCSSQSPWAVSSTLAYGFAAVSIPGGSEFTWCCACYELTFTSTSIAGKKMIVQATNTGADLAQGQFDLAIPGGGVGIYNGCTNEWGAPSEGWGAQYGGISSNTCSSFPSALQPGCDFRFGDFFEGADNPTVNYKQVTCPKALTDKTGCIRSGETPTGSSSSSSAAATPSSSTAPSSSSSPAVSSSSSVAAAISASSASASSSSIKASSTPTSPSAAAPPVYSVPVSSSSSAASPEVVSSTQSASKIVSSPHYTSRASSSSNVAGAAQTSAISAFKPTSTASTYLSYAPVGASCEVHYVYED